ncbi:BRCA2 and CDKN1A-interacting protein [Galendromus occidentalis]|uniref:BRCA2 and CDKN1A-interacting protein n=1 Tax=Galendromus occidentalis TaxID=34638 RepID=A0AAJ6QTT9_9ACAR|nr:BRCA2 and CDKN1A-interacting protein [Galendromus occidentalis]
MANPKKSKREEKVVEAAPIDDDDEVLDSDDEGDSGDDSSSAGEDGDVVNQVIDVNFEAFPPDDSDFHGIKKLLLQTFRNAHINVSDLANHLIELNKLSLVLRQSDDDMLDDDDDMEDDAEVFGVGGLLPLNSDREGVKDVKKFLLEQAGEKGQARSKLEQIFSSGSIGFLISERFVNIPPRIAAPTLKSIYEDWKKMPKSNKTFDFSHLVVICKQYKGANSLIYANGEEELFEDLADFKFSYEVPQGDADTAIAGKWKEGDEELKQIRQVLVLDPKKLPEMIQLIEENV